MPKELFSDKDFQKELRKGEQFDKQDTRNAEQQMFTKSGIAPRKFQIPMPEPEDYSAPNHIIVTQDNEGKKKMFNFSPRKQANGKYELLTPETLERQLSEAETQRMNTIADEAEVPRPMFKALNEYHTSKPEVQQEPETQTFSFDIRASRMGFAQRPPKQTKTSSNFAAPVPPELEQKVQPLVETTPTVQRETVDNNPKDTPSYASAVQAHILAGNLDQYSFQERNNLTDKQIGYVFLEHVRQTEGRTPSEAEVKKFIADTRAAKIQTNYRASHNIPAEAFMQKGINNYNHIVRISNMNNSYDNWYDDRGAVKGYYDTTFMTQYGYIHKAIDLFQHPQDQFNTLLDKKQEKKFKKWFDEMKDNKAILDTDDGRDYDYRGAFKAGYEPVKQEDGTYHWTDKYKKPNHATFSKDSQYAKGIWSMYAGEWSEDGTEFLGPQVVYPRAEQEQYLQMLEKPLHAIPSEKSKLYSVEAKPMDRLAYLGMSNNPLAVKVAGATNVFRSLIEKNGMTTVTDLTQGEMTGAAASLEDTDNVSEDVNADGSYSLMEGKATVKKGPYGVIGDDVYRAVDPGTSQVLYHAGITYNDILNESSVKATFKASDNTIIQHLLSPNKVVEPFRSAIARINRYLLSNRNDNKVQDSSLFNIAGIPGGQRITGANVTNNLLAAYNVNPLSTGAFLYADFGLVEKRNELGELRKSIQSLEQQMHQTQDQAQQQSFAEQIQELQNQYTQDRSILQRQIRHYLSYMPTVRPRTLLASDVKSFRSYLNMTQAEEGQATLAGALPQTLRDSIKQKVGNDIEAAHFAFSDLTAQLDDVDKDNKRTVATVSTGDDTKIKQIPTNTEGELIAFCTTYENFFTNKKDFSATLNGKHAVYGQEKSSNVKADNKFTANFNKTQQMVHQELQKVVGPVTFAQQAPWAMSTYLDKYARLFTEVATANFVDWKTTENIAKQMVTEFSENIVTSKNYPYAAVSKAILQDYGISDVKEWEQVLNIASDYTKYLLANNALVREGDENLQGTELETAQRLLAENVKRIIPVEENGNIFMMVPDRDGNFFKLTVISDDYGQAKGQNLMFDIADIQETRRVHKNTLNTTLQKYGNFWAKVSPQVTSSQENPFAYAIENSTGLFNPNRLDINAMADYTDNVVALTRARYGTSDTAKIRQYAPETAQQLYALTVKIKQDIMTSGAMRNQATNSVVDKTINQAIRNNYNVIERYPTDYDERKAEAYPVETRFLLFSDDKGDFTDSIFAQSVYNDVVNKFTTKHIWLWYTPGAAWTSVTEAVKEHPMYKARAAAQRAAWLLISHMLNKKPTEPTDKTPEEIIEERRRKAKGRQ